MLRIKPTYLKNKGFTLMEVILALGISSIIVASLYSLLDFSTKACINGDKKDQLLLNGRYAIEYIKNEIKGADMIISSDKIYGLDLKYPTNIGFVIVFIDREEISMEYRYVTYYKNKGRISRVSCSRINEKYPTYSYFKGHNSICEYVDSIDDTRFEPDQEIIYLDFKFKHPDGEELNLKSDIYIRCLIDY